MTPDQTALRQRLDAFRVDSGTESLSFVKRLARDNGWSAEYAGRVFREYKRFAFLCVASGHHCTPSDEVDQAWHLHLVYTRSYWDDFCGEVLKQPLHHGPTKGGKAEGAKFNDWYAKTRDSYRKFFGEEPPVDVWPSAKVRFGDAPYFRRVNTRGHWVIPKPNRRSVGTVAAGLLGVALVAGCAQAEAAANGGMLGVTPIYLWVAYLVAFTVGCLAGMLVRRSMKDVANPQQPRDVRDLDRYELAYLAGQNRRVFAAAMVELVESGTLAYDEAKGVVTVMGPLSQNAPLAEEAVYDRVARSDNGIHIGQLRREVVPELGEGYDRLADDGLMLSRFQSFRAAAVPSLLALTVPTLGAGLGVMALLSGAGLMDGGPFLAFAIASGAVSLVMFAKRPRRTRSGDEALTEHGRRVAAAKEARANQPESDFSLSEAVAFGGVAALNGTFLAGMAGDLTPKDKQDVGGSGCAGCGEGGDGGDGGGDGGCGGGGCGGCGGCG